MSKYIRPSTVFLLLVIALLIYSNYRTVHDRRLAPIPLSDGQLVVPKGCTARAWGNALEVDCPKAATIYFHQQLEKPSPTK